MSTFFADAFDTEDAAAAALADFDILLTMRERTAFPETLLRRLPKLRMIGITGAYVATLDIAACSRQGIVVCNTAGRGVTHSERTSAASRKGPHSLFGIQTWVALPEAQEDAEPTFEHHGKESLPLIESDGARVRLILGRAYGETAPVQVFSETFYADADLRPGSLLPLPDDHEDRGLYVVEGSISVAGQAFELRPDDGFSTRGPD